MPLLFDAAQAEADAKLTQDQLAARSNAAIATPPAPAPSPTSPAPATFSFMDKSSYDVSGNSVTNSSTKVGEAVDNLGNDIKKSSTKTPDILTLLESFKQKDDESAQKQKELDKVYAERQKMLEERRAAELERLNAEYDTEKAKKEADFAEARKPFDRRLQLLHDSPYGPNASLEEELKLKLSGLEKTHKLEMDTLFNHRQSSIALAQSAYEDKDFALAEKQIQNAKDAEQTMYDRSQDYYNMLLDYQTEERARQKEEFEQQKKVFDFNMKYGIKQPYYTLGGTVFNSQTLEPEYENVNGMMVRISDGKKYGSPQDFFQDTGLTSFDQIQVLNAEQDAMRDLVLDMQKKYIDAGILPTDTYDQALAKVQKNSRIYRQQTRLADGSGDGDGVPSEKKVRDFLFKLKQNSDGSWQEQWQEGADYLREVEGLNPTNYDKIFWELFHPEGLKGYEQFTDEDELS